MDEYPNWLRDKDRLEAQRNFRVMRSAAITSSMAYVEAEAGTGSRYVVVASTLPANSTLGGDVLISVVQPWQTCWAFDRDILDEHLVRQHLGNPARDAMGIPTHDGDMIAVYEAAVRAMEVLLP